MSINATFRAAPARCWRCSRGRVRGGRRRVILVHRRSFSRSSAGSRAKTTLAKVQLAMAGTRRQRIHGSVAASTSIAMLVGAMLCA